MFYMIARIAYFIHYIEQVRVLISNVRQYMHYYIALILIFYISSSTTRTQTIPEKKTQDQGVQHISDIYLDSRTIQFVSL